MVTSSTPPRAASHVGFNLGAIMLALALCGVGLAYAIDAAGRQQRLVPHRHDAETTLTRNIGGRELEIPLSWFRYAEQRIEGFARQIDLQLGVPLGQQGAVRPIEVTLLPRSRARPSARLLDAVYLHQFRPTQVDGPPGLVGKPLVEVDGFGSETVWYDPLAADPFVAKCSAPVAAGAAARCVRTVYVGTRLAVVYAFDEAILENWRTFDAAMQPLLRSIKAL